MLSAKCQPLLVFFKFDMTKELICYKKIKCNNSSSGLFSISHLSFAKEINFHPDQNVIHAKLMTTMYGLKSDSDLLHPDPCLSQCTIHTECVWDTYGLCIISRYAGVIITHNKWHNWNIHWTGYVKSPMHIRSAEGDREAFHKDFMSSIF